MQVCCKCRPGVPAKSPVLRCMGSRVMWLPCAPHLLDVPSLATLLTFITRVLLTRC